MLPDRPRVLIAEDHKLVAELYKNLLEPECDVIDIVCDGNAMVRRAAHLKPALIVVDIGLPILNGLEAGQRVKELFPAVKLLFVTMTSDEAVAAEAFRRGASGYLTKTCAAKEMLTAVRKLVDGGSYLSHGLDEDRSTTCAGRKQSL